MRYGKDKEQLKRVMEENKEAYNNVDRDTKELLEVVAKVKIPEGAGKMKNGEEKFEVCKAFEDYRLEGKIEGKIEGKNEGMIECVFELLEDCGEISEELRERICNEKDMTVIKRWHKAAAKAKSVEEFQNAMYMKQALC